MKRLILLLAVALLANPGCDDPEITSEWISGVVVDGKDEDWKDRELWYFEEEDVSLGVANDTDHLYLIMVTGNPFLAGWLPQLGFTIWLDPAGEKGRSFGLHIKESDNMNSALSLKVVSGKESIPIPADGSQGPAVATTWKDGVLIFEIGIPIRSSDKTPNSVSVRADTMPSLGFEFLLPERMSRAVHNMKMARNMVHNRGRAPAGKSSGASMKKPKFDEKEIWLKLKVAKPD